MDHKRQAAAPGHKERTGPYSTVGNYETGASGAWQTFVLSDMKTTTNFPGYGFIVILVAALVTKWFPETQVIDAAAEQTRHIHSSPLLNLSLFFLGTRIKSQWGEIIPLLRDAISHQDIVPLRKSFFTTHQVGGLAAVKLAVCVNGAR